MFPGKLDQMKPQSPRPPFPVWWLWICWGKQYLGLSSWEVPTHPPLPPTTTAAVLSTLSAEHDVYIRSTGIWRDKGKGWACITLQFSTYRRVLCSSPQDPLACPVNKSLNSHEIAHRWVRDARRKNTRLSLAPQQNKNEISKDSRENESVAIKLLLGDTDKCGVWHTQALDE